MKRTLSAAIAGAALVVGATAPYASARADHEFWAEAYQASEHFGPGDGPCVPWAGTFTESRTGGYKVVTAEGGQVAGEFHVNGAIDGSIELVPDNPSLPTYAGTYREKVDAVVTSWSEDGDTSRVAQYRLRSTLHGSDGSTIELRLSGKLTVSATGELVVARDAFTCDAGATS